MDAAPKAGRREWIGLAVLTLPTFLVSIDLFVLLLALPNLSADLGASSTQQLWINDVYGFLLAGFLLSMGTLGDRVGRRKLLLVGAVAFGVVSVLTAYASSPEMLIVCRALLGVAGATLMPSTLALIGTMFADDGQRARAFSLWGGTFTLGAIVGPLLGGVLLAHFWWGSVFLLGAPVMLVLLVVGGRVLPESRNEAAGRIDAASVLLSLAALLPLIWGVKELARDGWAAAPLGAVVVGLAAGVVFVRRQIALTDPVVDVGLLRHKVISTALVAQLCYAVTGGGVMLVMMLYFQLADGMSTLRAGFAMLPGMAAATFGFMVAVPFLAARIRPAVLISAGLTGTAAVLAVFTQISGDAATETLIVGFAVFSFCGSALVALGTGMIVGSAPQEQAGSAGSLAQMSNEFGGTLGAALLGTLGFAVYRASVDVPAGLSAADTATAADSLAGASVVAADSPDAVAGPLLDSAAAAFESGVHAVAAVGCVLMAFAAVLVARRLRHLPPIGQAQPEAAEPEPVAG
ncbi:MFS transporter [Actinocorallia sp. A-T 12471]|uniref:MFS transporter n=1 Tax=Actinocorallia sp. A-T 12471 TaxID=3089813 RepID=UPI0029D04AA5|nr:MFS transporter [Actinocorallia sp. A-T 12471]MDX6741581.1 MFS transporter [Actinocorallia sp. A-T 12471]